MASLPLIRIRSVRTAIANSRLWVGPMCFTPGIRRSRSGSIENAQTMGMFMDCHLLVFRPLVRRYAADMCPTANIWDTVRGLMLSIKYILGSGHASAREM